MTINKGFGQVIRNIAWHSSEKILRMFIGFFVGLWVARYLGPEQFGNFNYIMAWLGMFGAIAWLGVGDVVMLDMVRDRSDEGRILGSALLIRLTGSLSAVALALCSAKWLGGFSDKQLLMLGILGIGLPFSEGPAGIWLWFASYTNIRPAVLGKNAAMLIGAAIKILVILFNCGLVAMIASVAAESVLMGLFLIAAYLLYGERFSHWRFDLNHAWRMLLTGLPIVLSGLVASLNAQVDQIMLGRLAGMNDVGIYAAAMRFSEIWWVVPPMLIQTLAARYIYPKDLGEQLRINVARIISGMTLVSVLPCLVLSFIGSDVISFILGKQYLGASGVLMIHIWTAVPIFIDAAINQYLLATHRQAQLIVKAATLLTLNFGLAVLLVPQYMPDGESTKVLLFIADWIRQTFGANAAQISAIFTAIPRYLNILPAGAQGAATATMTAHFAEILLLPILYRPLRDLLGVYWQALKETPVLFDLGFGLIKQQLSKK